jgi:hypothetical protein
MVDVLEADISQDRYKTSTLPFAAGSSAMVMEATMSFHAAPSRRFVGLVVRSPCVGPGLVVLPSAWHYATRKSSLFKPNYIARLFSMAVSVQRST